MDKEELASKLSAIMDAVPVAEGVIYAKSNGDVLVGQTILEMDHKEIAKKVSKLFNTTIDEVKKGKVIDITLSLETGVIIAVRKDAEMVIGILGEDGRTSLGLLARQLKNLMH